MTVQHVHWHGTNPLGTLLLLLLYNIRLRRYISVRIYELWCHSSYEQVALLYLHHHCGFFCSHVGHGLTAEVPQQDAQLGKHLVDWISELLPRTDTQQSENKASCKYELVNAV